jgi:hypothetical protein
VETPRFWRYFWIAKAEIRKAPATKFSRGSTDFAFGTVTFNKVETDCQLQPDVLFSTVRLQR